MSQSAPAVNKPAAPASMPSSAQMVRVMGLVSLVCGLLIVSTHIGTLEPIRRNQEILTREAVAELLPGVSKQVTYYALPDGELAISNGNGALTNGARLIAGYNSSNQLLGIVIETRERGYADMIVAMYAYSPEQQAIVGFKVVEHKETPGLGDKIITDGAFLANFKKLEARLDETGQKLLHAIVTVKSGAKKNPWEVDAISGATISSRAVGRMLHKSAEQLLPVITKNRGRMEKGE